MPELRKLVPAYLLWKENHENLHRCRLPCLFLPGDLCRDTSRLATRTQGLAQLETAALPNLFVWTDTCKGGKGQ